MPGQLIVTKRLDFLGNTEKRLLIRTNYLLEGAKYLFHFNNMYQSVFKGESFNNKDFEAEADDRQSLEL
jgi:hypothetical protein